MRKGRKKNEERIGNIGTWYPSMTLGTSEKTFCSLKRLNEWLEADIKYDIQF